MNIRILIFEDSSTKMKSFETFLKLRLSHELNFTAGIIQRTDDSMLDTDLMTDNFDLILIDDDLGNNLWGNDIIDRIIATADSTPEIHNIPIVYYSAGTSITDLKTKTKHHGKIPCATFDNLADFVFTLIKAKYYK
jgi:hypothetical protein